MRKTILGTSDLEVGVMGLGCMGMSAFYGPTDEAEAVKTTHRAIELGVNFFDTSISYGHFDGENEQLLKKAIIDTGKREQAIICTKYGFTTKDGGPMDGSPEAARQRCEESLRNLGVDVIDLFYLHRIDPNVPVEESVGGMADLVEQGKVRFIGLSGASAENIRRGHAVHPISALQSSYSLWRRDIEGEILDTCDELGISLVAFSPLGRGFLTGKLRSFDDLTDDDWRVNSMKPVLTDDTEDRVRHNLSIIEPIAQAKEITPAQLALAWVHAQDERYITIPGTKRRAYLEENLQALDVIFTPEELAQLDNMQHMEIVGR